MRGFGCDFCTPTRWRCGARTWNSKITESLLVNQRSLNAAPPLSRDVSAILITGFQYEIILKFSEWSPVRRPRHMLRRRSTTAKESQQPPHKRLKVLFGAIDRFRFRGLPFQNCSHSTAGRERAEIRSWLRLCPTPCRCGPMSA
jgi:hypothetical protein